MDELSRSESGLSESQRLLVDFLHRELELSQTLIELAAFELQHGSSAHANDAKLHAQTGLDTIRKFIGRVGSEDEQEKILEGLARLEALFEQIQRR